MSRDELSGLVRSINDRLKNEARARGRPFVEVLELFAIERFLHRLGRSIHRDRFVLKGALLLRRWLGAESRPTRDIDLIGPADVDAESLRAQLEEILAREVPEAENDAIRFHSGTIVVSPIRMESPVAGLRAKFDANLGSTRLRYQVDVGLGDSIYPPTVDIVPGGLLGFPLASVRACTPYTTIAETIRRTFARRATPVPADVPVGLTDAFAKEPINAGRWMAYLEKGGLLGSNRPHLLEIVREIRGFAGRALVDARDGSDFGVRWAPGGPWK